MRKFLKKFMAGAQAVPAFVMRPFKRELPPTRNMARTGDARYVPQMATFKAKKDGTRVQMANRLDDIDWRDYDRVRFYPVIRDGIRSIVAPASRANIHFTCDRPEIAELAQQELGPLIPNMVKQLLRGALEFGYHAAEIRWVAKFDVIASGGLQQGATERQERYYPFIWTISRFAHFHPVDTRILIDTVTGNFAGIRQFQGTVAKDARDVPARKVVMFTHDKEYDMNYGVALTKPAVPFVDVAISLFDSMAKYADLFAVPGMIGRYPMGRTAFQDGVIMENADLMQSLLESIGAGHRMSLPSNTWDTGPMKWDVSFFAPVSTSQPYTDMLGLVNDQIRLAIGVNEMASSDTAKVGGLGDQGAEDKIGLFLANIESYLDEMKSQVDKLADQFRVYNFGHDAPPLKVYWEPVDMNVTKALLAAVVEILSSGQPIQDADGNLMYPDWGKILQDKGIPVVSVSGKRLAQQLLDAAQKQIGQQSNPQGGEGGPAGDKLVEGLKPTAPSVEATEEARRLVRLAIEGLDTAPGIKAKLSTLLGNWDENKHPRNPDGTFKTKEQMAAEAAAESDPQVAKRANEMGAYYSTADTEQIREDIKAAQEWLKSNPTDTKEGKEHTARMVAARREMDKRSGSTSTSTTSTKVDKAELDKAKAEKRYHDQAAWTKGRLPNVMEHEGDFYVVGKDGSLTLAEPKDMMPKLRQKLEERGNQAYAAMRARAAGGDGAKIIEPKGQTVSEQLASLREQFDAIAAEHRPVDWLSKKSKLEASMAQLDSAVTRAENQVAYWEGELQKVEPGTTRHKNYTDWLEKEKARVAENVAKRDEERPKLEAQIQELLSKPDPGASQRFQDAKDAVWNFTKNNAPAMAEEFAQDIKAGKDPHPLHFDTTIWGADEVARRYTSYGQVHLEPIIEKAKAKLEAIEAAKAEAKAFQDEYDRVDKEYWALLPSEKQNPEKALPLIEARNKAREARNNANAKAAEAKKALLNEHYEGIRSVLVDRHGAVDRLPSKLTIDAAQGFRKGRKESDSMFESRKARGVPKENLERGTKEFMDMVPERMRTILDRNMRRIYDSDARAHYAWGDIRVRHDDKSVLFHELMHSVEHDPVELSISKEYLKSRAGSEKLTTIYKGTKERGWKDEFSDHYTGKYYDNATEIMSMGVQGLMFLDHDVMTQDAGLAAHVLGRLMRKG